MSVTRVLVVDDQEEVRRAAADLLGDMPDITIVGEASDGAMAIGMADELRPDVILMDMRMPQMDGVEATKLIAAQGTCDAVLVHSAYGDESLVLDAFQAGARGYVLKGSSASDLVTAVRAVAAGGAHVSDEVTLPLITKLIDALQREQQTRVAAEEATDLLARLRARQQAFANQAAHELRTPLTLLVASLEMLTDGTEIAHAEQIDLAQMAMDATRRFARLANDLEVIAVGDLLDFDPTAVPLGPLLAEVVTELDPQTNDVRIDVDGIKAFADEARIKQVLHDVLRNALTASPPGETVTIHAGRRQDRIDLEIIDSGPGFDDETLTAPFQPFSQGPGVRASGLGVGLAVAHQLVTGMDGTIELSNDKHRGAIVRIGLPAA